MDSASANTQSPPPARCRYTTFRQFPLLISKYSSYYLFIHYTIHFASSSSPSTIYLSPLILHIVSTTFLVLSSSSCIQLFLF